MHNTQCSMLKLTLVLGVIVLSACGGGDPESTGGETGAENADFSFALVLPGQLGDRSFADSSNRGAERAIEELGVQGNIIETTGISEHEAAMRLADCERAIVALAGTGAFVHFAMDTEHQARLDGLDVVDRFGLVATQL